MNLKEILSPLQGYIERADKHIIDKLTTGIPLIDESTQYLFQNSGKKIRASLVLLAGGINGTIPDGVAEIAAAAEIVHAASLIHDDIIDQSFLRRGRVTVPKKYGDKIAVLAGDFMYSLALNIALDDGNPDLFPVMVGGTRDMVKGELYQLEFSNIESITIDHYYLIIKLKTAQFMSACMELGAVKTDLSIEDREKLRDFGMNIGYAFQIIDDTLDLLDDDASTGKDVGNDFKDGKITLPFLLMIEKSKEDKKLLLKYSEDPNEENWLIIKEKLKSSGAITRSIEIAHDFTDKAKELLQGFADNQYKQILIDIADFIVSRKF